MIQALTHRAALSAFAVALIAPSAWAQGESSEMVDAPPPVSDPTATMEPDEAAEPPPGDSPAEAEEAESEDAQAGSEEPEEEPEDEPERPKKKKQFILGLDGHGFTLTNGADQTGGGFDVRMGWHKTALGGLLAARTEFGGSYLSVADGEFGRFYWGGRLGLQFLLGVYFTGHFGYGWGEGSDGFTYDLGGAVDLLVLPFIRPGLHVDYLSIDPGFEGVRYGAHLEFAF